MNRYFAGKAPQLPKVEKIEVSEKNYKLRTIALAVFLSLAVVALGYSLLHLLSVEDGWKVVEADSATGINCGTEFVFNCYFGGGTSATASYKKATLLYSQAVEKAYQLFSADDSFDGVNNVCSINASVNQTLEVDSVLYQAFGVLSDTDCRALYLGPVCVEYNSLFFCTDDSEAAGFDPCFNEELSQHFGKLASFASDPDAVELRLMGENRVMLSVSDEYLQYAQENGVTHFIDFSWMRNAFIIDYLADFMIENGFTAGTISSCDGFTRTLDTRSQTYTCKVLDRVGNTVYPAAEMEYSGRLSIVCMRNYPTNTRDRQYFYEYADGTVRTARVDISDGISKSSLNNIICVSRSCGCAETAIRLLPFYAAESFPADAVDTLSRYGISTVLCSDGVIAYNDSSLGFGSFYDKDGVTYTAQFTAAEEE